MAHVNHWVTARMYCDEIKAKIGQCTKDQLNSALDAKRFTNFQSAQGPLPAFIVAKGGTRQIMYITAWGA